MRTDGEKMEECFSVRLSKVQLFLALLSSADSNGKIVYGILEYISTSMQWRVSLILKEDLNVS